MRTSLRLILLAALASLVWPMAPVSGAPLYTINVQADPPGSGSVTLDPQKSGYARSNIVTVTAVPNAGMIFTG